MTVKYDRDQYSADLSNCVHCGFCLPACPTYLETGSEADSPRGRIVMMRQLHDGTLTQDLPDLRRHLDLCLGCRACETACPSNVHYSDLLDIARDRMNESRPFLQRSARLALLTSLTDPEKLRNLLKASKVSGGMPPLAARMLMGSPNDTAEPLAMPVPSCISQLPSIIRPVGGRRARVGLLVGCVMRVLFGDVNSDTAAVLAANGCEVLVNQAQGCCGALHGHNGFRDQSKALAKKLIDAFTPFDGLDAIVINSAGCGSSMKEFGRLLADEPAYAAKASAFSDKCLDVSEFLDKLGWNAPLTDLPIQATYHDACHLAHAQKVVDAPRRLLKLIPNLSLVSLPESDVCCGSAGIYNVTEPKMARQLLTRKVDNILSTGAKVVITGNPGCLTWISSGLEQSHIPVLHPVSVLRAALAIDPLFATEL